jgi:hypothetical protein
MCQECKTAAHVYLFDSFSIRIEEWSFFINYSESIIADINMRPEFYVCCEGE